MLPVGYATCVLSIPVCYATVPVVGEEALVGALPADGGAGSSTHFTPEGDALSAVARHVGQGHQELRRHWRRRQGQRSHTTHGQSYRVKY